MKFQRGRKVDKINEKEIQSICGIYVIGINACRLWKNYK